MSNQSLFYGKGLLSSIVWALILIFLMACTLESSWQSTFFDILNLSEGYFSLRVSASETLVQPSEIRALRYCYFLGHNLCQRVMATTGWADKGTASMHMHIRCLCQALSDITYPYNIMQGQRPQVSLQSIFILHALLFSSPFWSGQNEVFDDTL